MGAVTDRIHPSQGVWNGQGSKAAGNALHPSSSNKISNIACSNLDLLNYNNYVSNWASVENPSQKPLPHPRNAGNTSLTCLVGNANHASALPERPGLKECLQDAKPRTLQSSRLHSMQLFKEKYMPSHLLMKKPSSLLKNAYHKSNTVDLVEGSQFAELRKYFKDKYEQPVNQQAKKSSCIKYSRSFHLIVQKKDNCPSAKVSRLSRVSPKKKGNSTEQNNEQLRPWDSTKDRFNLDSSDDEIFEQVLPQEIQ